MIINSLVVVTLSLDITTLTADPSPNLTNKFEKCRLWRGLRQSPLWRDHSRYFAPSPLRDSYHEHQLNSYIKRETPRSESSSPLWSSCQTLRPPAAPGWTWPPPQPASPLTSSWWGCYARPRERPPAGPAVGSRPSWATTLPSLPPTVPPWSSRTTWTSTSPTSTSTERSPSPTSSGTGAPDLTLILPSSGDSSLPSPAPTTAAWSHSRTGGRRTARISSTPSSSPTSSRSWWGPGSGCGCSGEARLREWSRWRSK